MLWTDQLARTEQLPTEDGSWETWLSLAGRGAGKTRGGAEWGVWKSILEPRWPGLVAAPTYGDVRDICAEGESGLINILKRYDMLKFYNRSLGEIRLKNGALISLMSADEPDRFRGRQFGWAWLEELGSWKYEDAYHMIQFALRLGDFPQTYISTTPRPTRLLRALVGRSDGRLKVVRGSTFDNAANLPASVIADLKERYEGTRLGRQELYAEMLEDVEGALWRFEDIIVKSDPPDFKRVVIAVDPAVTVSESSDETGIVVCAKDVDNDLWVLADKSGKFSAFDWATRVNDLFEQYQADRVIVEKQPAGTVHVEVLHSVNPYLPVTAIDARRGKMARAEPIAALYEQHKVFHTENFEKLVDQLCSWDPGTATNSPDRLDALVHALTALADTGPGNRFMAGIADVCEVCSKVNPKGAVSCVGCGSELNAPDTSGVQAMPWGQFRG